MRTLRLPSRPTPVTWSACRAAWRRRRAPLTGGTGAKWGLPYRCVFVCGTAQHLLAAVGRMRAHAQAWHPSHTTAPRSPCDRCEAERELLAPAVAHWQHVQQLQDDAAAAELQLLEDQQAHGTHLMQLLRDKVRQGRVACQPCPMYVCGCAPPVAACLGTLSSLPNTLYATPAGVGSQRERRRCI